MNNDQIIVTTPEQLSALISSAIEATIPKLAAFNQQNNRPEVDRINLTDAVEFLTEQGFPITRNTLYNLVFKRDIPFAKCGRRTIFSKKELLQWLDNRIVRPETKSDVALRLAKSANRKERRG